MQVIFVVKLKNKQNNSTTSTFKEKKIARDIFVNISNRSPDENEQQ